MVHHQETVTKLAVFCIMILVLINIDLVLGLCLHISIIAVIIFTWKICLSRNHGDSPNIIKSELII